MSLENKIKTAIKVAVISLPFLLSGCGDRDSQNKKPQITQKSRNAAYEGRKIVNYDRSSPEKIAQNLISAIKKQDINAIDFYLKGLDEARYPIIMGTQRYVYFFEALKAYSATLEITDSDVTVGENKAQIELVLLEKWPPLTEKGTIINQEITLVYSLEREQDKWKIVKTDVK